MRHKIMITLAAIALAAFAGYENKVASLDEKEHLKVVVKADGTMLADGAEYNLAEAQRCSCRRDRAASGCGSALDRWA
jgi:hypothetical protein